MREIIITKESYSYEEISSLLIIIAAIAISFGYKINEKADYDPGTYVVIEGSKSTNEMIKLPLHGPLEAAVKGVTPDVIEIIIEDLTKSTIKYQLETSSLVKTINFMFTPFFVSFYENNINRMEEKIGKNYNTWPNSWRMGWVLRNAFVNP